jgi:uncharacterized membrane protein YfcA
LVGSGGVLSAIETGEAPPLVLTLLFSLTTVLGMIVGRGASHHLSARHVQIGFVGVLVCVSLGMMGKVLLRA